MKVPRVMYVTIPMVDYIPLGYNSKNGYVFHNYEKSKAQKQKKTVIPMTTKNI